MDNPSSHESPVGFYGKLPSHGDFLCRGLPQSVVAPWDAWLQASLASSKSLLGATWLDCYLASPIWRFAFSPGVVDDTAYVGVLIPSVDRVGRYFPLSALRAVRREMSLVVLSNEADSWLEFATMVLLRSLHADENDPDEIGREFNKSADEIKIGSLKISATRNASDGADLGKSDAWRFALEGGETASNRIRRVLEEDLESRLRPLSIWWTDGSGRVEPSLLLLKGLPSGRAYADMLSGFRPAGQWAGEVQPDTTDIGLDIRQADSSWSSASISHSGHVREKNEDSFLDRPEASLWVVADGLGGLSHGEMASRAVTEALGSAHFTGELDSDIEQVRSAVESANTAIQNLHDADGPCMAGSTVVVLLLKSDRGAVLWAGDSRAYQIRGASIKQLTVDHALPEEEGVLTKAVGGEKVISMDVQTFDVQPGDQFLLCSDGLYRELDSMALWKSVSSKTAKDSADRLMQAVLGTPARDNVTAIVVGKQ